MSRTVRNSRFAALLVGAVAGSLALAGCGAGQVAQTAFQANASGGAHGTIGMIEVVDAQIPFGEHVEGAAVYQQGGNAPLSMRIVNTGPTPDRLVSITSPAANSVQVTGSAEVLPGIPMIIEGEPAATPTATGAARTGSPSAAVTTAPGQPSPTGEVSTPTPTTAGAATRSQPPTSTTAGGERVTQAVLTGLRENVQAGLTYEVVIVFERAGQVRLDVPVANPTEPRVDEHAE